MFCNKKKFKTEKDAEIALENIRKVKKKYKREKHPIRYYHCENCKNYHLTSREAYIEDIHLIHFDKFLNLIKQNRKSHSY
jgi:hypothetical protein